MRKGGQLTHLHGITKLFQLAQILPHRLDYAMAPMASMSYNCNSISSNRLRARLAFHSKEYLKRKYSHSIIGLNCGIQWLQKKKQCDKRTFYTVGQKSILISTKQTFIAPPIIYYFVMGFLFYSKGHQIHFRC